MSAGWDSMALQLVLAGSDAADLAKAKAFLCSKGWNDVTVCSTHSQMLSLLHQHQAPQRMVIVAEVRDPRSQVTPREASCRKMRGS